MLQCDSVPVKYLSQIKTISALKTLIAFLDFRKKAGKDELECSIADLSKDNGISINSIRNGLNELISLKIITIVGNASGRAKVFKLNLGEQEEKDEEVIGDYKLATAARKKKEEQASEIKTEIKNLDLNNLNFFTEDIDSISAFNKNSYMTDSERYLLAKRIVFEVYRPRVNRVIENIESWASRQIGLLKGNRQRKIQGMLEQYRTEQIVASIIYWTEINETPNGLMSLHFLLAKNSRTKQSNMMTALGYFKNKYVEHIAPELARQEMENRLIEQQHREQELKEQHELERKKVEEMTSEQFVNNYMDRFSHIKVKKEN